ncbi:alpha/beta hydrolase [Chelativorans composti]|jgi:Predicted esterase of the alpha/beta hydrolase fold|uniref:RBBP9/YdeN family alpha/beta hydrolase n=1 Tax=Chelativorans composti TaxID=768533 RepID=A0ABW5DHV6_9HYPH|nr:serine hydrolase family protein [bacterium SGD-2]
MKAKDADILIVPGFANSGPDHWQSRWQARLPSARRVEQREWLKPVLEDWVSTLAETANAATRPLVLVGHSLGVPTIIHALPHIRAKIAGAFLVAPPDVASPNIRPKHFMTFGPYPHQRLPFPSIVVASRNDHYASFETVEKLASAWGSLLLDAGEAGHINTDAGYGPWPEGGIAFARFVSRL